MIVTVTLNAAIDRTLVVPNFQPGQRHRASIGFPSAGGKGINVARALKRLGAPVVATGLAGGRTGTLLVEELTGEGILNDFVRIREESRTSTAVVDPTSGDQTEINEHGPHVAETELELFVDKLLYLAKRAEFVVLSGSLPRGVDASFYGQLVRDLARRQLLAVLDTEGEALRFGVEAEPYLVSPNQREAEALVGHEFVDPEDLAAGLDEIAGGLERFSARELNRRFYRRFEKPAEGFAWTNWAAVKLVIEAVLRSASTESWGIVRTTCPPVGVVPAKPGIRRGGSLSTCSRVSTLPCRSAWVVMIVLLVLSRKQSKLRITASFRTAPSGPSLPTALSHEVRRTPPSAAGGTCAVPAWPRVPCC